MLNNNLITSLYKIGCIQFGEFKLKSGQTSSVYVNLRKIISYPDLLQQISSKIWESIHTCHFDVICGVPYTALPIATCISLTHNIPMVMRRKEKKEYGTKQLIEGEFKSGQTCLIIEDIITSGSSILETANDLENVGLKINNVVAFIDREQGGKARLSQNYQTYTILTLSCILQTLIHSQLLSDKEQELVKQFLEKP